MYADIGPSPLSTNNNTLAVNESDDSRVEYAQINHAHGFIKKEAKPSESVTNKQPPVPGTPNSVLHLTCLQFVLRLVCVHNTL